MGSSFMKNKNNAPDLAALFLKNGIVMVVLMKTWCLIQYSINSNRFQLEKNKIRAVIKLPLFQAIGFMVVDLITDLSGKGTDTVSIYTQIRNSLPEAQSYRSCQMRDHPQY